MSTKIVVAGAVLPIERVIPPDNLSALMVTPRIQRLARSLGAVTQIAPVVLEKTVVDANGHPRYRLWAGHDRYAALLLAEMPNIRADIREGSAPDFLLLQQAENNERRPVGQLVDAIGRTNREIVRPRASREAAENVIAAARGARGGSIERQARRERSKGTTGGKLEAKKALVFPAEFETWGVELPEAKRADILLEIDDWKEWRAQVSELEEQLRLKALSPSPVVKPSVLMDAQRLAQSLLKLLWDAIPAALCAECRGERCRRCLTGVVGHLGNAGVTAKRMSAPPPKAQERKVKVVDESGKHLVLDKEVA